MTKLKLIISGVITGIIIAVIIAIALVIYINNSKASSQHISLNIYGYTYTQAELQPLITQFENSYPNVTVNYTQITGTDPINYQLNKLANNNSIDIYESSNTNEDYFLKYSSVNPYFSTSAFKQNFFPLVYRGMTVLNNGVLGIPISMNPIVIVYKTNVLNSTGVQISSITSSFNSFNNMMNFLTNKYGASAIDITSSNYNPIAGDVLQLFIMEEGTPMNVTSSPFEANISTDAGNNAVNYYSSFLTSGIFDDLYTSSVKLNYIDALLKNKVLFDFMYYNDYIKLQAQYPNDNFDFSIYPAINTPVDIASYNYFGVNKNSQESSMAWKFVDFLGSSSSVNILNSELNNVLIPVNKNANVPNNNSDIKTLQNISSDWNIPGSSYTLNKFNSIVDNLPQSNELSNVQNNLNSKMLTTLQGQYP